LGVRRARQTRARRPALLADGDGARGARDRHRGRERRGGEPRLRPSARAVGRGAIG
jgi:hypothetical protein